MMNLRHIEVFHSVYVNGSVSAAARALAVSQPSVSNVLRHAETRLGFPLFKRTRGRLVPTDDAHILFREVVEIYDRVGSLKQTSKNLAHASDGFIRISVLPGFAMGVAPSLVAEFRAAHPKISFDIQTLNHADILKALQERHCDIAIGYDAPVHERLEYKQIGRGELVLLFRKSEMPDPPARFSLAVLEGREFVSLAHSGPLGAIFNREVARQNLDITETVTISTMYVAAALVREGIGVAIVDSITARACAGDDLDYRPLQPALGFGVYCVSLADRPLARLTQAFVDLIARRMQTYGSPSPATTDDGAPSTKRASESRTTLQKAG